MCSPSWLSFPPPSLSHPSGSSQSTSPEHPVSCIEPGLVIYFTYDNIHVSILFSQIIPPSPSPTESNSGFFTSVPLLLSQRHYFANKGPSSQSYGLPSSHVWMWELDYKESWAQRIDAFELWCWRRLLRVPWTAGKYNQSILRKSVLNIHLKDWCQSWNSNTLATWWEELTHLKRPWCWERLKAGEEGDDRGWDG